MIGAHFQTSYQILSQKEHVMCAQLHAIQVMVDVYKSFEDIGNGNELYVSDRLHLSAVGVVVD